MKRPSVGVTVFATLFTLNGVSNLLAVWMRPSWSRSEVVVPAVLTAIAYSICGIGLFMVQRWARWLALILASVSVVWVIAQFLKEPAPTQGHFVYCGIGLASGLLAIWYFLRPGVKAQFSKAATSDK